MSENDDGCDEEPFDYDAFDVPLPRYQGEAIIVIDGEAYDLNALGNPFDD